MEIELHKGSERGENNLSWLKSKFSFSFANYYNPKRMGFGKLRVLNDDIILGGNGFGMHPHDNMEIITIVQEGTLLHKDSLGNETTITKGDIQVMSAGSGLLHSEVNASATEPVSIFQLWIYPKLENITPVHKEAKVSFGKDELSLLVSGFKDSNAPLTICQDASISYGEFTKDTTIDITLKEGFGKFVFVVEGKISCNSVVAKKRDALALSNGSGFLVVHKNTTLLLIEVPL